MPTPAPDHDLAVRYDRNGLQVLTTAECTALLRGATLGRIGLSVDALPLVLPVNYWFDGERILIRTTEGTGLQRAAGGAVVAFEVDDIDPMYHAGWSVVVTGRAEEIVDPVELEELRTAPLARWAHAEGGSRIVAIQPDLVSGRRIQPGRPRPGGR